MKWFVVLFLAIALLSGVALAEEVVPATADTTAAYEPDPFDSWYGQLEFRSALVYDFTKEETAQTLIAPVVGYENLSLGFGVTTFSTGSKEGFDTAVASLTYRLGDLNQWGVTVSWAKYFTLSPTVVARYDFDSEETTFAFGVEVLDVSFDQGNSEQQRTRTR